MSRTLGQALPNSDWSSVHATGRYYVLKRVALGRNCEKWHDQRHAKEAGLLPAAQNGSDSAGRSFQE